MQFFHIEPLFKIKDAFGIEGTGKTLSECKATKVPGDLVFEERGELTLLAVNSKYKEIYSTLNDLLHFKEEDFEDLEFHVMPECFAILGKGDDHREWMKELHEAILKCDVAFYSAGDKGYGAKAIEIVIYSKEPRSK